MNKKILSIVSIILVLMLTLCACGGSLFNGDILPEIDDMGTTVENTSVLLDDVPEYSGSPYVAINDNQPSFTENDYTTEAFEEYAELDYLGRCGVTFACVGVEIMPTEKRGDIGMVKPTGWVTSKYDFVDGKYLYNRCHLIGYQLTGENANTSNLITGTRYMNTEGMLPFENMIADYVKETENHVLYRVTPIFEGDNLVASGVQMEAWSVEDDGDGICFNVYCYNVQPGVVIDYATGKNWLDEETTTSNKVADFDKNAEYVLNTSSKKIHSPECSGAKNMSEKNKQVVEGSDLKYFLQQGYEYCSSCLDK
ncbi:MAG: DNA/RNA non-specific endonuclease [Clostridia bacterium]|nr:DNA/RNA non-specific endonuclease [Clostridia bacterium]